MSLRSRLSVALSILMLLVCATLAWLAYWQAGHEADELLDGQLVLSARLIDAQILHAEKQRTTRPTVVADDEHALTTVLSGGGRSSERHPYEQTLAVQVWSDAAGLVLQSDNAKGISLQQRAGFSDVVVNGQPWRIYTRRSENTSASIQVAHTLKDRDIAALEVASQVAWPALVAVPIAIVLVLFTIWRTLRPLERLTHEVERRTSHNLNPLPDHQVMQEVRPLVDAFNRLLARLSHSLAHERRFNADAAHELRTPLAGLKVQAQVAVAASDPAVRDHALQQVLVGLQRAERLVNQMLRLARLDPDHALAMEPVAIRPLYLDVQDIHADMLAERGQRLVLNVPDAAPTVLADPQLLEVALRNLVNNAIRYSPDGATLNLSVSMDPDGARLRMTNPCAELPPEVMARLTQRFYRGLSTQQEGSGLGLAIVARIAQLHGTSLELAQSPTEGFVAVLGPLKISA